MLIDPGLVRPALGGHPRPPAVVIAGKDGRSVDSGFPHRCRGPHFRRGQHEPGADRRILVHHRGIGPRPASCRTSSTRGGERLRAHHLTTPWMIRASRPAAAWVTASCPMRCRPSCAIRILESTDCVRPDRAGPARKGSSAFCCSTLRSSPRWWCCARAFSRSHRLAALARWPRRRGRRVIALAAQSLSRRPFSWHRAARRRARAISRHTGAAAGAPARWTWPQHHAAPSWSRCSSLRRPPWAAALRCRARFPAPRPTLGAVRRGVRLPRHPALAVGDPAPGPRPRRAQVLAAAFSQARGASAAGSGKLELEIGKVLPGLGSPCASPFRRKSGGGRTSQA